MNLLPEFEINRLIGKGYLQIPLDKSSGEAISNVFKCAYSFFRQPVEEKILNVLPEDGGYRPFGLEYSRSPDYPDEIETFTASERTRTKENALRTTSARLLHQRMLVAFRALESLAEALTSGLAEVIAGRSYEKKLRGGFRRWSRLQLNYSRPAETKATFINEAHEDGVLMTLACATAPGFEVQTADGGFIPITTQPDEVIAMPGEITWLLSGGLVRPLYHRVLPLSDQYERLALLFLGDIHPTLCEPWVKNDVNANVDIGERVFKSAVRFGLQGFAPE